MSKTPKTDLIEAEYWDGELNARDLFERMGEQEVELAQAQRGQKVANRDFRMALESLTKARLELAAERAMLDWLESPYGWVFQRANGDALICRETIRVAMKENPAL